MADAKAEREGDPPRTRMQLRLLATADLHMHILPYDYLNDLPNARWGLSQTAKLIQQARMDGPNTLLLDAGDFLHGTAMGDYVVESARGVQVHERDLEVHPMIAAMNHLRYDVATLGNHDFDRGVGVLLSAIEQAEFPVISANTVLKKGAEPYLDSTFVPPYTILNRAFVDEHGERHLIRIGVIGFLPPNTIHGTDEQAPKLGTRDIVEAAKGFVPRLRAKGVNLVVALAHSGVGAGEHREGMENAVVPLCEIDGIDVVIGGHSHQCFPLSTDGTSQPFKWADQPGVDGEQGMIHGKPVVVPGFWGSHLGVIDLELEQTDEGWKTGGSRAELRPVPEAGDDAVGPEFSALLGQLHESTLMHMRTRIGYSHQNLQSYFALVGMDPSTRLVQQAMKGFTCQLVDLGAAPDLPVLASSAAFKCGGLGGPGYYTSIRAGELTLSSVADLYIFPNELALVRADGRYLRNWLERAASVFCQITVEQRGQVLKEASTPGYLLESVLGLSYQIDLTQPARFTAAGALTDSGATRIVNLTYQGQPVADGDEFLLATSDFRIRGGGGFPIIDPNCIVPVKPITIRDLLRQHIEDHDSIAFPPEPQWRFAPAPGASVVFPSAPVAREFLPEVQGLNMRCTGERDRQGFSLYELML